MYKVQSFFLNGKCEILDQNKTTQSFRIEKSTLEIIMDLSEVKLLSMIKSAIFIVYPMLSISQYQQLNVLTN
jgi:hypothetical protein